jgi:hypothetical protein
VRRGLAANHDGSGMLDARSSRATTDVRWAGGGVGAPLQPHALLSSPAKAGDQYAAASRLNHDRLWNTGRPVKPGDDRCAVGGRQRRGATASPCSAHPPRKPRRRHIALGGILPTRGRLDAPDGGEVALQPDHQLGIGSAPKLREIAIVQVICPTCQNVFAGMAYRSFPYFAWGCFRYFLVGCCLAEAREAPVRLRPVGFGQTAFAYWLD